MPRFIFVFRGGAVVRPELSVDDRKAQLEKWAEWRRALKGHHLPGGHPLDVAGATVRGAERSVSDRPYSSATDLVTGTFLVEAASLLEATELAKGCPILDLQGSVEVRPILERPT